MNGVQTGALAASTINVDNATNTTNIGTNQNFFRTFKKSQSSFTRYIGGLPICQALMLVKTAYK